MVRKEITIECKEGLKEIEIHLNTKNDDTTTKKERFVSFIIGKCIEDFVTDKRFSTIINNEFKEEK